MDINIRSVLFVIGFIYILQFVVLYYQYKINNKYAFTGMWLLWSGFELAGFLISAVNNISPLSREIMLLRHLFSLTGFIFLFFGLRMFTGKKIMPWTAALTATVYLVLLIYSTYVLNSGEYRSAVNNLFLAIVLIYSAFTLFRYKPASVSSSSVFTSLLLFIRGLMFGYLSLSYIVLSESALILTPPQRNEINILSALLSGIFLTFGIVIMLNQKLQSELSESIEHFRMIFETSPDAISISTIDEGVMIDANEKFVKDSGYSREELIGAAAADLKLWDKIESRSRIISELKANKAIDNVDVIFYDKNGKINYGLLSSRVISINGKSCVLHVVRNITDIRKSEEKMNEINERFRLAFENANIGMCLVATDGKILRANDTLGKILGYSKEELESRNVISITHPDYVNMSTSIINDAVERKGLHKEFEKKYVHKNGAEITAVVSTSLVKNSAAEPLYFITQIMDVTERKRAQEELEDEKDKYKLLTENMKDVVWTLDPETMMFTYVSPSVQKLRGYTAEEVMAEPVDAALTPEGSKYVRTIMAHRVEKLLAGKEEYGEYFRDEILQPCKDGSHVWTEVVSSYYYNEKSGKVEIHGVTRDITERKKAENEIKDKNDELINMNAEKDKFFSIIAHDLRSPFNGFLGLTDVLANSPHELTQEQFRKISINLNESANNLYNLLNNLLEWSKIQGGQTEYNPVKTDLKETVNSAIHLFDEASRIKNVFLSSDIPDGTYVFADKFMLDTIIRNLLSNAIKFSVKGGCVLIYTKETDDEMHVSVKDTGIGMDKNLADNLFQIDAKVSRAGTCGEPGTGLGLILCKEFVNEHGGRIWAVSEEGRGSVFSFTIKKV